MEDLDKIIEQRLLEKQQPSVVSESSNPLQDVVKKEYEKQFQELQGNEEFNKAVQEVVSCSSKSILRADLLEALNQEQKNELVQYQIQCEKDKLAYRKKHEKKVVREEVKAEVQARKIDALKKRYGYLYDLDANGQPKKFIASKFVNKYKEICNWYDGTSQGFKKIVTSTLRIVFYVALAYAVYKGLIWLNGNLPNLMAK